MELRFRLMSSRFLENYRSFYVEWSKFGIWKEGENLQLLITGGQQRICLWHRSIEAANSPIDLF